MTSGAEEAAEAARGARSKGQAVPQGASAKSLKRIIIGGGLAAVFSKETGMSKYSKLIGGIVGYVAGYVISYAVAHGLGTCVVPTDTTTCTVLGMHASDVSDAILGVLTILGVYIAPPNSPIK